MKCAALGLAMGLAFGVASAQQVWRCEQEGLVRYTDQPCEKSGRSLPARDLKANVADGLPTEAARVAAPASAASGPAEFPASAPSMPSAAVDEAVAAQPVTAQAAPANNRRAQRGKRAPLVAMQGLMDTDFVQRGYAPRRQNPLPTTNP